MGRHASSIMQKSEVHQLREALFSDTAYGKSAYNELGNIILNFWLASWGQAEESTANLQQFLEARVQNILATLARKARIAIDERTLKSITKHIIEIMNKPSHKDDREIFMRRLNIALLRQYKVSIGRFFQPIPSVVQMGCVDEMCLGQRVSSSMVGRMMDATMYHRNGLLQELTLESEFSITGAMWLQISAWFAFLLATYAIFQDSIDSMVELNWASLILFASIGALAIFAVSGALTNIIGGKIRGNAGITMSDLPPEFAFYLQRQLSVLTPSSKKKSHKTYYGYGEIAPVKPETSAAAASSASSEVAGTSPEPTHAVTIRRRAAITATPAKKATSDLSDGSYTLSSQSITWTIGSTDNAEEQKRITYQQNKPGQVIECWSLKTGLASDSIYVYWDAKAIMKMLNYDEQAYKIYRKLAFDGHIVGNKGQGFVRVNAHEVKLRQVKGNYGKGRLFFEEIATTERKRLFAPSRFKQKH